VAEYLLKAGQIETNPEGMVVGADKSYTHLVGEDITDVIRRQEARGIQRQHSRTQQTARLPTVQPAASGFRKYGKAQTMLR
jgi:hypothetical protein